MGPSINDVVGNWEGGGGGVKHWAKLPTEYTKTLDMGEEGVKNQEKLPTLFMDGPYPRDLCHQGFLIWDHSCVNAPFLIHSPCVITFFSISK